MLAFGDGGAGGFKPSAPHSVAMGAPPVAGSRAVLPHKAFYVLPLRCPSRVPEGSAAPDPCAEARVAFERELGRVVRGFTRFPCTGIWYESAAPGVEPWIDRNACYFVSAKNPAQIRALDLLHHEAATAAGEVAGFQGGARGDRVTRSLRPKDGRAVRQTVLLPRARANARGRRATPTPY